MSPAGESSARGATSVWMPGWMDLYDAFLATNSRTPAIMIATCSEV